MPDAETVILVRQYRYAIDRWVWELAAGSLKPGEDPAEGASRECEEETGLAAGRVEFLGAFYPTPGVLRREDELLSADANWRRPMAAGRAAQQDEDEDIRTQVFTLEEVRGMIERG